ncbi:MAG: hypothetical protein JEZ09_13945 [Salinivirgaceae bacterium]|nr:hypothetical protein [Salinivirgaceae bacterium]
MEPFTLDKKNNNITGAQLFNPFPGLRPFSTDESHLFFGREGQSQEVLKFLAENRFIALLGTSGSGKSSLMYCGVIPILQGGFITKAGVNWKIITSRPGQSPVRNLAISISEHYAENNEESELQKEFIYTSLSASSVGLVEMLKQVPRRKDENILLLIDQFEELFRFRRIKNNTEAFNEVTAYIKLLLEVLKQNEVPAYIVMTMRSDFIGECAQFQELTKLINDSHYLIPQMTRDDFRQAIEGPIAVGGGKASPLLVQQLLNDLGENPDQLPILQHALMRTWDAWIKSGTLDSEIEIKDYENIGKLEKALSEHANEAYNELSQQQKDICQSLFKTLTEKGGDNRGVRRPTPVAEIAEIASVTSDEVIDVVEHFRVSGRSFLSPPPSILLNDESVIDISHESLMRIWDKLIIWVSEEYEAVQMYKRLSDSAEKFQLGETGLWRPPDLLLALSWRDKQNPTLTWAKRHNAAFERAMVYLETSHKEFKLEEENKIKQQKRTLRRSRVFAIVLGTASIISIFFLIQSFLANQEAVKQTEIAIEQTKFAEQKKEEAEEQKTLAEKQTALAIVKEKEALDQKNLADQEKKKAERSAAVAKYQQRIATQKSKEAEEQRAKALESAEEAKRQQKLAEQASLEAQQLRMLSISQSMAVKSLQIDIDTTLKGLVAYQAYLFNKDFKGNSFNPDVYNGLYFANKFFSGSESTDFLLHEYQVRSLELFPNSNSIVSTGTDGKIIKWNINNNKDFTVYFNTNKINRTLAINPEGKYIISGLNDGELLLFNLSSTPLIPQTIYNFSSAVSVSKFIDDNTIFAADKNGVALLINKNSNAIETISNKLKIKHIEKNGSDYFVVHNKGYISRITDLKTLEKEAYKLEFSSDGKSGKLLKFDEANADSLTIINAIALSNNNLLALGDINGNILIFDTKTFEFKQRLSGHTARINDLQFDELSNYLASASNDGAVHVWQLEDLNQAPLKFTDNEEWVLQVKFNNDGTYLFAAYADGKIRRWATSSDPIAKTLKQQINRNFTLEEWQQYVAKDIEYKKTFLELP